MYFLSAFILSISDVVLLITQLITLSIIDDKTLPKCKTIIVAVFMLVFSFCSELLINTEIPSIAQYTILLINNFSGCVLSMYLVGSFTIRNTLILMIIQVIGSVINSGIYFIIPVGIRESIQFFYYVMLLIVRTVILIIICSIKKITKESSPNNLTLFIPTSVYVLTLASILIENGLVELINYITTKTELKLQAIQIFLSLLVICILIMAFYLIINVVCRNYYGTISKLLEKQVDIQLEYYAKMEKMITETRKFRHDYNNHMNCISGLLNAKKYDEIKDYIETISGQMPSGEFMFKTGNYIADAILSDKQEQASSDSIVIEFDGHIPQNINNTDLCVILSNALDNSIEACHEIAENKVISVYGNYQQGYVVLIIKNPTVNVISNNDLPYTTKKDRLNHGFGLSNIENVVNKYDGKMQISCNDGMFTLSITLNNTEADLFSQHSL